MNAGVSLCSIKVTDQNGDIATRFFSIAINSVSSVENKRSENINSNRCYVVQNSTGQIKINYDIAEPSNVHFTIYNCDGSLVRMLEDSEKSKGSYSVMWDGKGNNGHKLTNGIYYVVFKGNRKTLTEKIVLIK